MPNLVLTDEFIQKHPLIRRIWLDFFRQPIDSLNSWPTAKKGIRKFFYECEWHRVYDFVEFVAEATKKKAFADYCNQILEREVSSYRFVGSKIIQLTSQEEITAIEEALSNPMEPVSSHIQNALNLYSDRKNPDYRNSIKEAISGVEAACSIILESPNASLGSAMNELSRKLELHPALKKGFSSLYGYTSTAEGIRHAMLDKANLQSEDAKFMLVACSAFINYLIAKANRADLLK